MGQPQQQQQPPNNFVSPRDGGQIFMAVTTVHACGLYPFLRKGQGCDQPGVCGVVVFFAMVIYAHEMHSLAMMRFVGLWLVALAVMRLRMDRTQHSRYTGYPWLVALPLRFISERRREAVARFLEPVACLLAGIALQSYDKALGNFIFMGFFSLSAIEGFHRMMARRRQISMNDAIIMSEQYR